MHEAADIMASLSFKISSLIPKTIFLISPFAGAVNMTLLAPDFKCFERLSSSLHTPVLSITIGSIMLCYAYFTSSGLEA